MIKLCPTWIGKGVFVNEMHFESIFLPIRKIENIQNFAQKKFFHNKCLWMTEWLILLNQNPPFFPPKRAKNRHQFFTLKKLTPLSFLLYFYVVIFPMPTQNCKKSINSNSFPRFFFQMSRNGSKSARPKNFFPSHKSPKPPTTRQPATISHSGEWIQLSKTRY